MRSPQKKVHQEPPGEGPPSLRTGLRPAEIFVDRAMSKVSGATTRKSQTKGTFDAQAFLDSASVSRKVAEFHRREIIFRQGDPSEHIFYIQKGGVKLSVLNVFGKEAVVGILGPGEFFGEGCLTGLPLRMASATAITPTTVLAIEKEEMLRVLHTEHALSDRFISS